MFGNLMNNRQIIKAYESGELGITPWNQNNLKSAHYPLTPKLLFQKQPTGVETQIHTILVVMGRTTRSKRMAM